MCGIVGWIDWEQDLSQQGAVIEKMTSAIRHRGPDAKGMWLSPRAALGHRRLIVIDPEGGIQPMVCKEGDYEYVLTYNGEIYNFQELRRELEARGHKFRSYSDTEVLLRSYLEWGEDCTCHLNGIFAFGIWDGHHQRMVIARDHLGVKPLFYAQRGSAVLFGSELKALLAHPLVEPEIDADGLAEIFNYYPLHVPGYGLFRNIFEVRPGHRIIFDREGSHVTQYWSLRSAPHTDDLETTAEHILGLMQDSVGRQLVADVPVVTLLSGGLDSSGITALAIKEFQKEGKQLQSYSVDFEESSRYFVTSPVHRSLDAPWFERVSKYFGTQHHNIIINTPELLDNLLVPMYAHDQPSYIGQSETSLYLLFKAIKQDATVALSGEAADELFGGYPLVGREKLLDIKTFPWVLAFGFIDKFFSWLSPEVMETAQPFEYIARRYQEALAEVPWLEGEDSREAKLREFSYMILTRFLPLMLDRKDRSSMAVGLEVRVPFCDYRLVEYVWNIPWKMRAVGDIEKGILRQAFANVLPDDVRNRRKSAYPTSQHPSYKQGVYEIFLQILNNPNAPVRPFINVSLIKDMIENKMSEEMHAYSLLPIERIIQINSWLKDYHVRVVV